MYNNNLDYFFLYQIVCFNFETPCIFGKKNPHWLIRKPLQKPDSLIESQQGARVTILERLICKRKQEFIIYICRQFSGSVEQPSPLLCPKTQINARKAFSTLRDVSPNAREKSSPPFQNRTRPTVQLTEKSLKGKRKFAAWQIFVLQSSFQVQQLTCT